MSGSSGHSLETYTTATAKMLGHLVLHKETEHNSLVFQYDAYSAKSSVFSWFCFFGFFYRGPQITISYCDLRYHWPDDIVSIPCEKNKTEEKSSDLFFQMLWMNIPILIQQLSDSLIKSSRLYFSGESAALSSARVIDQTHRTLISCCLSINPWNCIALFQQESSLGRMKWNSKTL